MPSVNEFYAAFSFIGFVLCAIPFYWHLEGTWRNSRFWSMHFENAWHSLEYWHMLVHGLDWSWMPDTMHQLDRMEP
jgi:pheromone a factor receptor